MILLTGASGFIGKHLLHSLIGFYGKNSVIAFTSKPIEACPYIIHNDYTFEDDIFIKSGYADSIDTIVHAGAFTPKDSSESNDWSRCNQNIFSVDKILRSSLPQVKKILYLSTLDVYGRCDIISEESVLEPHSLYGYSKLYGEKLISSWAEARGIHSQILRIGHVYGPGEEFYKKVIPSTMKKIIQKDPVELWGDGHELRAFIYIKDVIKAILNSLNLNEAIGPVNLVSDNSISIKDIVKQIIEVSGEKSEIQYLKSSSVPFSIKFNNSKMKKYLLSDELPLIEGLQMEWNYMVNLK